MKRLSRRQQQVLDIIRRHLARNGQSPTVREIGRALGVRSTCTVYKHLLTLEKKGFITRARYGHRSIEVPGEYSPSQTRFTGVPLVGRVAAGQPLLAAENVEGFLPIPADMAQGEGFFALKVRGDSMCEAGIFHGDIIVARQQTTATDGDIIVALLDDEATVKRFFREDDHIRLEPENPEYSPILTQSVQILGKVTLAIRQF
ncbi:MAG TPA: transcriptional repressor LexA [Armatimonadota bacterium]|nr:transcriptional repressor LexA [Armatimonadota bacterium]